MYILQDQKKKYVSGKSLHRKSESLNLQVSTGTKENEQESKYSVDMLSSDTSNEGDFSLKWGRILSLNMFINKLKHLNEGDYDFWASF